MKWPGLSRPSSESVRRAYNDRVELSEAATLIGKLLAQWPRAPHDEPYLLALATALKAYPRCVAMAAIEPASGIASEKTFGPGPTVADVVAWCEREVDWMRRIIDAANNDYVLAQKRTEAIAAERRGNEDRSQRPTLDELRCKHGPNWGLEKVGPLARQNTVDTRPRDARKIVAEYGRTGKKPVYAGSGILISPGLLEIVQRLRPDDDWGP